MSKFELTIRIISRPKFGFLRHVGLLLPDGRVAHCAPGRGEHISTLDAFAAGRPIRTDYILPPWEYLPTLRRISAAMLRPQSYVGTSNNCEMFVNRMIGREPLSPQLQGVTLLAALAVVIGLAAQRN